MYIYINIYMGVYDKSRPVHRTTPGSCTFSIRDVKLARTNHDPGTHWLKPVRETSRVTGDQPSKISRRRLLTLAKHFLTFAAPLLDITRCREPWPNKFFTPCAAAPGDKFAIAFSWLFGDGSVADSKMVRPCPSRPSPFIYLFTHLFYFCVHWFGAFLRGWYYSGRRICLNSERFDSRAPPVVEHQPQLRVMYKSRWSERGVPCVMIWSENTFDLWTWFNGIYFSGQSLLVMSKQTCGNFE